MHNLKLFLTPFEGFLKFELKGYYKEIKNQYNNRKFNHFLQFHNIYGHLEEEDEIGYLQERIFACVGIEGRE